MPPLSSEQALVVHALRQGSNAIVNAVAGSGKTTTILQIAAAFPDKKILAVLYNRRLKFETKIRAVAARVKNLTVDNYHGFAFRHYSEECTNDHGLERVVVEDAPLRNSDRVQFDILCLDEVQDMTPLLFRLVRKMIADTPSRKAPLQYVVLGDTKQEIYSFNHADARFLAYADECFPTDRKWVRIDHRTSYRLTRTMAEFLNAAVLPPEERVRVPTAEDDGPKPRYLVTDTMSYSVPAPIPIPSQRHLEPLDPNLSPSSLVEGPWTPLDEVARYLSLGIPPSDILILAPSTRSPRSPARKLANAIALSLPAKVHVADAEADSRSTDDEARGKVLVCSYHQAKGIERPCVIVLAFDGSYNKLAQGDAGIANAQYVALTRSTRHLTVVQGRVEGVAKGLRWDGVERWCEIIGQRPLLLPSGLEPAGPAPLLLESGTVVSPDGTAVAPTAAPEGTVDSVPATPTVVESAPPLKGKWLTERANNPVIPYLPLLASLPTPLISHLFSFLSLTPLTPPTIPVPHARTKQTSDGLLEKVQDLVGRSALLSWEGQRGARGVRMVQDELKAERDRREALARGEIARPGRKRMVDRRIPGDVRETFPDRLLDEVLEMEPRNMKPEDYALVAHLGATLQSSYLPRLVQLERHLYDFLTPDVMASTSETLSSLLSDSASFWFPLKRKLSLDENSKATILGMADAIDKNTLLAIRCADNLRPEHVLELACLAALDVRTDGKSRKTRTYKLANLATGQTIQVDGDFSAVLAALVRHKLSPTSSRTPDPLFRANIASLFAGYLGRNAVPSWLGTGLHDPSDETARRVFEDEGLMELMLRKGVLGT